MNPRQAHARRVHDASASPGRRGKKLVALATSLGMGASLFGLSTFAIAPAGADGVTEYTPFTQACVAASIIGDQNQTASTGVTVTAPEEVEEGETFTVRYQIDPGAYPNSASGATTIDLSRQKIDVDVPDGTEFVSGSIVAGSAINISGTTPDVLGLVRSGGTGNTGTILDEDDNDQAEVVRMSGNNQIITSTKTSGQSQGGIIIPKTKTDLEGNPTSGDTHFQLPAFDVTYRVTTTGGNTIEPTLRVIGNASTYGNLNGYATFLARASLFGTQNAPTRCIPADSSSAPLNAGGGPLASIDVVAPAPTTEDTSITLDVPATATVNEEFDIVATVEGDNAGVPNDGTVDFYEGSNLIGTEDVSNGEATLSDVSFGAAGTYNITAEYSGDDDFNGSVTASAETVTVSLNDSTTELSAPATATVNVGFNVSVEVSGDMGTPTGSVTFTEGSNTLGTENLSNGEATLSNVSFSSTGVHTITATYNGDSVYDGSDDTAQVTVDIASVGTVSGNVVDENDDPIAGATVQIRTPAGVQIAVDTTDANGDYEFTDVDNGEYRVYAGKNGYKGVWHGGTTTRSNSTPVIVAGDATTGLDFELVTAATISGKVYNGDHVLGGVTVSLRNADNTAVIQNTVTSGEGSYSFIGVPTGDYKVYVYATATTDAMWYGGAPGAWVQNAQVIELTAAGADDIDIQVAPGSTISGSVTVNNNTVAGAVVDLRYLDGSRVTLDGGVPALTVTDANGEFTFSGVEAGQYFLVSYGSAVGDVSQIYTGAPNGARTWNNAVAVSAGADKITIAFEFLGQ